jgi:hypothetical protein
MKKMAITGESDSICLFVKLVTETATGGYQYMMERLHFIFIELLTLKLKFISSWHFSERVKLKADQDVLRHHLQSVHNVDNVIRALCMMQRIT